MNKIKPILSKIVNIICIVIIAYVIISFVFCKTYTIESGSMTPKLSIGCLVTIVPDKLPEVNDIAAFSTEPVKYRGAGFIRIPQTSGIITIHRVISIDADGNYLFKGDAADASAIQKIPAERIVGKELWHNNLLAPLIRLVRHI